MKRPWLILSSLAVVSLALAAACGDDDAQPPVNGGQPDATAPDATPPTNDSGQGDGGSACSLGSLPADYTSASYDTNAKAELDLRKAFSAFLKPISDNEARIVSGDAGTPITKATLDALWQANPSVKAITTAYYQGKIDSWLTAYEAASNAGSIDLQMAAVVTSAQTPPANGGFYERYAMSGALLDIKQAIEKGSFTAAFYNHATGLVAAGNLTETSIDRLIAAWGAHSSFQNNHTATAGATNDTRDVNSAGYAARRTPKDGKPGPYTRAKAALIKAKAAIAAGASCNAERDDALKTFFLEWEKGTYATVVYYFSSIADQLANPPGHTEAGKWAGIIHAHGECVGFISGFKTTPQAHRKITDAQIDTLLGKALMPENGTSKVVELKTSPANAVISLNGVLADIKSIYGFTDEEMTSFKQVYAKQ